MKTLTHISISHSSQLGQSISILRVDARVVFFIFYSNFNNILKQTVETLIHCAVTASDLGLHCLLRKLGLYGLRNRYKFLGTMTH